MNSVQLLKDVLYFLAIVNPASKILFLSAYQPPLSFRDNFRLSRTASFTAAAILLATAVAGNFVLKDIFRIDLYSLKICGGIILFFSGFSAVRNGHFMLDENHKVKDFSEVSIIPLAAPLIVESLSFSISSSDLEMRRSERTFSSPTSSTRSPRAFWKARYSAKVR